MAVEIYLTDPDLYEELGIYHKLPLNSKVNMTGSELMELCGKIKPRTNPLIAWQHERKRLGFDKRQVYGAAVQSKIDKQRVISMLTAWGYIRRRTDWFQPETNISVIVQSHRIDVDGRPFGDEDEALNHIALRTFEEE